MNPTAHSYNSYISWRLFTTRRKQRNRKNFLFFFSSYYFFRSLSLWLEEKDEENFFSSWLIGKFWGGQWYTYGHHGIPLGVVVAAHISLPSQEVSFSAHHPYSIGGWMEWMDGWTLQSLHLWVPANKLGSANDRERELYTADAAGPARYVKGFLPSPLYSLNPSSLFLASLALFYLYKGET